MESPGINKNHFNQKYFFQSINSALPLSPDRKFLTPSGGNFPFLLPQSITPHILPRSPFLAMFETPSENFSFILPQSTLAPQETPPSIGRRNGLLSSWPAQEPLFGYVRGPLRKLFFYFTPINMASPGNPPQYWTTERPPELLACPGALLRSAQIAKSQECYMGAQSPYYSL